MNEISSSDRIHIVYCTALTPLLYMYNLMMAC